MTNERWKNNVLKMGIDCFNDTLIDLSRYRFSKLEIYNKIISQK